MRRRLPRPIPISPVHPDYDARVATDPLDFLELEREAGYVVTRNEDGSISSEPDPELGVSDCFRRLREVFLGKLRAREEMARADEVPR